MIMHTIVPAEIVFQRAGAEDTEKYIEAELNGEKVLVAQLDERRFRIVRLLSTCPRRFLDPIFMPGNMVDRSKLKISE